MLRIYDKFEYVIWPKKQDIGNLPEIVDGKALRQRVNDGALEPDDTIYQVSEFARVKPKRAVQLVDASGAPVDSADSAPAEETED